MMSIYLSIILVVSKDLCLQDMMWNDDRLNYLGVFRRKENVPKKALIQARSLYHLASDDTTVLLIEYLWIV